MKQPENDTTVYESSRSVKQNYTPALVSLAVLYFMMGFITCLNDTLVPFFRKGFNLTYSQSSLVQFYFFLTYGIMSIPAGKIVERVGYKSGMVLGFGIAAFGATLFFPAAELHLYALFLAALFVIAIGIVLLQVAANPYITVLGPARTASSRLTLIQGVGSTGTTLAPLFGAYFILSPLASASKAAMPCGTRTSALPPCWLLSRWLCGGSNYPPSASLPMQNQPLPDRKRVCLAFGIFGWGCGASSSTWGRKCPSARF